MKKFNKIISAALAAVFLSVSAEAAVSESSSPGSIASAPAVMPASEPMSASSTDDKALEQAIVTAKSRILIPDEYETFNFNKYVQYGRDVYSLAWERNDGIYGYIGVTVTGGIILSYNNYSDSKESKAHFAKLSADVLYSKAAAFIKQLNPNVYENIKIDKSSFNAYISGVNASFSLSRSEGNIPVDGNSGTIRLNKDTGELLSFDINWTTNFKGKDTSKLLTQTQIKEQYSKLIGLEPYYRVNTDEDGNKSAVLLYRQKSNDRLDALTGKISTFNPSGFYDGIVYKASDMDEAASGAGEAGNTIRLSPAELKAVETEKALISASEAAKIIFNDKYSVFSSAEMELQSSTLYQNEDESDFNWSLSFKKKNEDYSSSGALVNASTGEIISFYEYSYIPYSTVSESSKKFSEKTSDSNVNAALTSYLGEKFSEYKLESGEVFNSSSVGAADLKSGKNYSYYRYVNGIKVDNDYITVRTNYTGKLTDFSYTYSDIKFPSPDGILEETDALASLYEQKDLRLSYALNVANSGSVTSALLYTMPAFTMDAFTGKLVNADGSAIADETGYSDLENHSAKKMVEKLKQNGITLPAENGKLMPDSRITEKDFINLVAQVSTDWNDFYYGYQVRLYSNEKATIVSRAGGGSSSSTALSSTITRQDAIKCLITALGGKKFAELEGFYQSPYKDVDNDSEYVGYFALADGMKIIKANSSGNINPKNKITRVQALGMIYNYLLNN